MAIATKSTPSPTKEISVLLIGNPNTGKTTLFNALTGLRHRVGNYAGVTVETKTGKVRSGSRPISITDVPGTYSLSPRSPDEMLAVELLLGHRKDAPRPDVVVCILDASNLDRNLYLASQVLEIGIPAVLAVNMIDVAESRGISIDFEALQKQIGITIVPVQANAKKGISELILAIESAAGKSAPLNRPKFPEVFRKELDSLRAELTGTSGELNSIEPFLLERAILDANGQTEIALRTRFGADVTSRLANSRQRLAESGCAIPAVEAKTRYSWIAEQVKGAVRKPSVRLKTISDKIDKVLLHRVFGLFFFLLLMALVFQSIFSWATPIMDLVKGVMGSVGEAIAGKMSEGALRSLVQQGIVEGVGNVLVFLPQIIILFGFIAILEDCGYMARAAFLMDKLMSPFGLSGKSFIPLMSSFACAIPGVMAARTIEDRRDRLTTILIAPLMSCSARLPVYIILIAAFIPDRTYFEFFKLHALVMLGMYMIGLLIAPLVAWTLKRTMIGGDTPVFLMELPSYKMPSFVMVGHRMLESGWSFLRRAGTIIFASTIVIWALQFYPRSTEIESKYSGQIEAAETKVKEREDEKSALAKNQKVPPSAKAKEVDDRLQSAKFEKATLEHAMASQLQAHSYLGRMGHAIEPIVRPLGWDWRIGMAAIASFPAREVVVSALGVIYSVGKEPEEGESEDDHSLKLRSAMADAKWPDGTRVFNIPTALSLMVFFALCCQCVSTLAVIRRETNSWHWPIFTFVYMTALAYVGSLLTYQIGMML